MGCQILVNNLVGVKGSISTIADQDYKWSHNETLGRWREKNPQEDLSEYHRRFSLVIVPDKNKEDLLYLTEPDIVDGNPVGVRWSFIEPDSKSEQWRELFMTGQITKTFEEILPFLKENEH